MKPSLFPLFVSLAAAQNVRRQLAAGGQLDNTFCIEEAYGGSLGCTANDINIVDATNIVIKDDGCAFPGDTVTFTADFQVSSSATTRFDIGLYMAVDGDPNGDGAKTGGCTIATPFIDNDGDACGDITSTNNPQYPNYELTVVCRANADGWLMLPYCSSWRQPGKNDVCTTPSDAVPGAKSKCKCDTEFFVEIPVPGSDGDGSGIGDPHMQTWYNRKYDFHGICDLIFLKSQNFMGGLGLDINIRTAEKEGTSYIASAVLKIGEDKFEVHEDGSYFWNNELNVELPAMFGDATLNHTVVDEWLPIWEIVTPRGGRIFLQVFDVMVDVKLFGFKNEDISDSVGLLGDFDSGFLMDRQGQWMFDTEAFGAEWQVRDDEPMLFHDLREPQFPSICQIPDKAATKRRLERSIISEEEAHSLCSEAAQYFDACVMDLQLFGNKETAKAYSFLSKMR